MKKITALMLILIMSILLISCGSPDPETDPDLNPPSTPTVSAKNSRDAENEERKNENRSALAEVIKNRAEDYDIDSMTANEFVAAMALGWNLGNTLDATGGDGIDPVTQETSWGNPEITQELIKAVADSGFTTIRIPVTWYHFTDADYNIDEVMLSRVKQVVDWSLDEGLFVIINTHHDNYDPKSTSDQNGWIDVTDAGLEGTSAQLKAMWVQIAEYFKEYDHRLIFEGMNEPREIGGSNEWWGNEGLWDNVNRLGLDFVEAVRSTGGNNSDRFLMVPAYACSSSTQIWGRYQFPENDDRVILSIHAYIPYDFALNVNGTDSWSADNAADTRDIDTLFNDIQEKLVSKGHTAVIGEFGAMAKGTNFTTRAEWASYYVSKAAEHKIPVIWWDNNAFTGEGELFGLIRRLKNEIFYTEIMEAMINAWYGSDFHFTE